jgi:hypothetical protein
MILKQKKIAPAPEGLNNAVCIDVVDLGMVETQWGKKPKVRLVWEVEAKQEDGRPFLVVQTYGASISPKSTLRKHLKGWRGRDFNPEELEAFDLEKIVGVHCQLIVVHNEADDGRIFANVETILKPGSNKISPSPDYVRVKDRTDDQKSGGHEGSADLEDSDIPF